MTPERILDHMRERLMAVGGTRNPRKRAMIPIEHLAAYADALALVLDQRDRFAAAIHGATMHPHAEAGNGQKNATAVALSGERDTPSRGNGGDAKAVGDCLRREQVVHIARPQPIAPQHGGTSAGIYAADDHGFRPPGRAGFKARRRDARG